MNEINEPVSKFNMNARPELSLGRIGLYIQISMIQNARLTVVVENLHAVSHFKDEKFDLIQYAKDFTVIFKESIKRASKCCFNT